MYTIHFSALETALLPYFLFIVYGAIVLWIRAVRAEQTEFVLSVPEPELDPLATEFERELVQRVMTPPKTRKRLSKSVSELISDEWDKTHHHLIPKA